jgi:hypothetical protein
MRAVVCRGAPDSSCAPTRSASATRTTSPPCAACLPCAWTATASPARASPSAAWRRSRPQPACEAALAGSRLAARTLAAARAALVRSDFQPISDARASAPIAAPVLAQPAHRLQAEFAGEANARAPRMHGAITPPWISRRRHRTRRPPAPPVGQAVAHESAARTSPARRSMSTTCRSPRARCTPTSASPTIARAHHPPGSFRRARRAGVVDVITRDDVPGHIDIGPVFPGDPLLLGRGDEVEFHGQVIFAVAADSYAAARRAARLARIEYEELPACLSIEDGLAQEALSPATHAARGDAPAALARAATPAGRAAHRRPGADVSRGPGVAVRARRRRRHARVFLDAEPHGRPEAGRRGARRRHAPVTFDTRRMGGAFGGKETHANQWACIAASWPGARGAPSSCAWPRRRHARHGQAPSLPEPLRRGLR